MHDSRNSVAGSAGRRGTPDRLHKVATLAVAFFAALSAESIDAPCLAFEPTRLPNIVLIMADDQGWGDMAYNGHSTLQTPTFDEMAATGLRFDNFYAAAPVCSPTRGSVLTGRHPNRFGCFKWGHTLRPQEVTIAEALKPAGYATGHFGKWHLGSVRAESAVSPGNSGFDIWFSSPNFFENSPLMSRNGRVVETEGEGSQVTVDAALEFIRAATRKDQPFLAVIWFGSPHTPYVALQEDRRPYAHLPQNQQNYLGEITAMDRAVGNLRKVLRELNIAGNTLLWYTSDNGAMGPGSNGGLRGKKGTLWEGGIRVPAIIEWPARIPSPRTTAVRGNTCDIYPTLLELTGVTVPDQPQPLDGISLVPLLDGRMEERPQGMGFWDYPEPGRPVRSTDLLRELAKEQAAGKRAQAVEDGDGRIARRYPEAEFPGPAAWIEGDYKLHRIPGTDGRFDHALYNLREDEQEAHDVAAREPERVARMRQTLEAWQTSVVRSLNGEDY